MAEPALDERRHSHFAEWIRLEGIYLYDFAFVTLFVALFVGLAIVHHRVREDDQETDEALERYEVNQRFAAESTLDEVAAVTRSSAGGG